MGTLAKLIIARQHELLEFKLAMLVNAKWMEYSPFEIVGIFDILHSIDHMYTGNI